jgi:molybdopterin-guanine dinucleotide biosynthesis protein A
MGTDKARVDLGGRSLLQRAVDALRPVVDQVLLATGPTPRYAEFGIPLVLDARADGGPLAGLEAALAAVDADLELGGAGRVAVLAVDMPGVDSALVERLFERAERDDVDALLLASDSGVEPLCAVYHVRVLPAVRAALDAGERRMIAPFEHSLASGSGPCLASVHARELGAERATDNLNDPADLERARSHFDRGASA